MVPVLSALFAGKGHGAEERAGKRNEKKLEKEEKTEFLLLKFLNVELIVCTGFEAEKKKKPKSLNIC